MKRKTSFRRRVPRHGAGVAGAGAEEIRSGRVRQRDQDRQHHPYSGPASAYGAIGKAINAYFRMVTSAAASTSARSASSPTTTATARRRRSRWCASWSSRTRCCSVPVARHALEYRDPEVHEREKVPQLFVATGATKWNDPKELPWTMGWQPNYQTEARIYARHILQTKPNAKIAVLYQNDDYGKDYLKGFEDGLGPQHQKMIVAKSLLRGERADGRLAMLQLRAPAPTSSSTSRRRSSRRRRSAPPTHRLEADPLPEQRLQLGGLGPQAGRPGKGRGHHHQRLRQGPD